MQKGSYPKRTNEAWIEARGIPLELLTPDHLTRANERVRTNPQKYFVSSRSPGRRYTSSWLYFLAEGEEVHQITSWVVDGVPMEKGAD